MTRIMLPFLLLVALAAQAMGVLNACNRFGVPAMASTFFNIGSVECRVAADGAARYEPQLVYQTSRRNRPALRCALW